MAERGPPPTESRRPMIVAALATALVVLAVVFGPRLWRWATYAEPEPDLGPPPVAAELEGVDLRRVHMELLPAWVIAQSDLGADIRERHAFDDLHQALQSSPTLDGLMTTLREHTRPPRLHHERDRAQALEVVERWNQRMQDAAIPYLVRANVMESTDGIRFYALSYEVVSEGRVAVDGEEHRVRFVRRVDRLNLREWYLGMTREHGHAVTIILDTVNDFALNEVWPLLDPSADAEALGELHAAFAPAVTEEVVAQLSAADVEVLQRTAAARRDLVATTIAITQRERCGSRFQVSNVPWNGFNDEELEPMRRAATGGLAACRPITSAQLETIEQASTTLRHTKGLRAAVESLAAWTARPSVIHEARHAADFAQAATARARTCAWCGPHDPEAARVELSAYLAQLAWTRSPATALFQMCHATSSDPGVGHGEALDVLLDRTGHACSDGALPHANEVVRALEADAFGRSDPIEIVGPERLRVPVDNLRLGR